MFRRLTCAFAVLVIVVACHQQSAEQGAGHSVRNVITQDEIDSTSATNVYDLIARLRGDFLKDRGRVSIKSNTHARAVVFLNDQEYGILETMRNIPVSRIAEVRFYPGTDAVIRYGSQYGGGVVLLISRTQ